jgi:hypothetical protein
LPEKEITNDSEVGDTTFEHKTEDFGMSHLNEKLEEFEGMRIFSLDWDMGLPTNGLNYEMENWSPYWTGELLAELEAPHEPTVTLDLLILPERKVDSYPPSVELVNPSDEVETCREGYKKMENAWSKASICC